MGKKRRTRSQKIIAQLKRELRKQQAKPRRISVEPKIEAVSKNESTDLSFNYQSLKNTNLKSKIQGQKEEPVKLFSYNPQLVKKDLFKTFYLSLLMFGFIGFCYWYFHFFQ